jgi:hypothetical protein
MPTESLTSPVRGWHLDNVRSMPFVALLCIALGANFLFLSGYNQQRILEIAVLCLAGALAVVRRRPALQRLFPGAAGIFLAAFFVLGLLGSLTAFSSRFAVFEVASLFLLYLFATQVGDDIAQRGTAALRAVLQALAVIVVLYSVQFVVAYVGALCFGNRLTLDDFTPGFSNYRLFNHVQTPTLPLLVLLCCLTPRTTPLRRLWSGIAAYWWMALFATSGRGTMIGIAAGCVIAAVVLRRGAHPYLRTAAWTAMLGLVAYVVFLIAIPALTGTQGIGAFSDVVQRTAVDPASGRMLLWHRAAELVAGHPWLGVGPMHFAHNASDLGIGAHPHDWILQVASEWGVPALGCLSLAIALALRTLLRTGKRIASADNDNAAVFAGLSVAAVAILVDGLVSGLFVMPQSQLAVALYLGCAIGWARSCAPPATDVVRPGFPFGGILLVLLAMAAMALVWPDMLARSTHQPLKADEAALNSGVRCPRLWDTGYF